LGGDPAEFGMKILGTRNMGVAATILPAPKNFIMVSSNKETKESNKATAREILHPVEFGTRSKCDNCTKQGLHMMRCPCHTVA
jgi:hypothetical protein